MKSIALGFLAISLVFNVCWGGEIHSMHCISKYRYTFLGGGRVEMEVEPNSINFSVKKISVIVCGHKTNLDLVEDNNTSATFRLGSKAVKIHKNFSIQNSVTRVYMDNRLTWQCFEESPF
jgi:hypothetical protein